LENFILTFISALIGASVGCILGNYVFHKISEYSSKRRLIKLQEKLREVISKTIKKQDIFHDAEGRN
jgi:membrane protein DedA with SNARE-associated domain